MRHVSVRIAGIILLGISLLVVVGCAEKTPEQKLVQARANYSASLGGWSALEPTVAEPVDMEEELGEMEEGEIAGGEEMSDAVSESETVADEGEEGLPVEPQPVLSTVLLDILIRNTNEVKLPGITIDISHANEAGDEIGHWRVWVDTSKIERGPGTQISHRLEEVEIVEGYGFHVEVRSPIAEADRGEYREFSDLP